MNDPPRLTHFSSGLGLKLLESARADDPPSSARRRAFGALGVGAGIMFVANIAGGAAGLSTGAAAGAAGSGTAKAATWVLLAKWIGGSAVAAAVTTGAIATIKARAPARRVDRIAVTAVAPAPPPEPTVVVAPREIPSAAPNDVDSQAEHPVRNAKRRADPSTNLVDEVAILDRAHAALADRAPDRALHDLDDHDRRFPSGALSIESRVLRIEALAAKGEGDIASHLAESFLAQNPTSAHAARVRSLLLSIRNQRPP
jgi:hypothetical protein